MTDPTIQPAQQPARSPQPPRRRIPSWLVVALALAVALGVSLTFAPVRSFAAQVLSIFRVQKIQTLSITQADIESIGKALDKGDSHVSLEQLGDVWIDGKPDFGSEEPTPTTLEKAQAAVDFPIRLPQGVEGTQSVLLQPGYTVKFKLHVDKVNELLHYYGAEKLFSSSVDGKIFEVKMPPTVYVAYGKNKLGFTGPDDGDSMDGDSGDTEPDPFSSEVFTVQTRGPELQVPDGVNPLELRDVLLGLPFIPDNIRTQLAGVSDWQNTLLIPNFSGSTKDITVAGNPGVLITEPSDPDDPESGSPIPAAVMWRQDGVLRALATRKQATSLKLAESMAR
jgi:hypothetical protein